MRWEHTSWAEFAVMLHSLKSAYHACTSPHYVSELIVLVVNDQSARLLPWKPRVSKRVCWDSKISSAGLEVRVIKAMFIKEMLRFIIFLWTMMLLRFKNPLDVRSWIIISHMALWVPEHALMIFSHCLTARSSMPALVARRPSEPCPKRIQKYLEDILL